MTPALVKPTVRGELLRIGLLVLVVGAVFAPILNHTFIEGDDYLVISDNPDFKPPTLASLRHYWTSPHMNFYVPVVYTSWWVVAHFAGSSGQDGAYVLSPGPFHALSLLAHLLSAVAAYLALGRLVRERWAAWAAAGVFALHPLQVEAVAWASTVYSAMSGAFALLATWAYFAWSDAAYGAAEPVSRAERRRTGKDAANPRRWRAATWLALTLLFYAVALLTKPTIILLPAILWLIDVFIRRRPWRRVAVPLGFMLLLGAVPIALATRAAQPAVGVYSPMWLRPLVAGDALAFYLQKMVAPLNLYFDYSRSPRWLEQSGWVMRLTWLVPAVVTLLAAAAWRRTRWPLVAVAVVVLALMPMLGLARFDYQRYSTVADRYAYFALIAPAMLVAVVLARWRSAAVMVAVGIVVLALGVLSAMQVRHWASDERFFAYVKSHNPNSMMAQIYDAQQSMKAGRTAEALEAYRAIITQEPRQPRVRYMMGNLSLRLGQWDQAIEHFAGCAELGGANSQVFSNMGIAHAQAGRGEEALKSLTHALELNPTDPDAHLNLAIVLMGFGRTEEARQHYQQVIRLNGNVTAARRGLTVIDSAS